jgi:hypothetical protein
MYSFTVEISSAVSTVHEGRRCTETQVCLAVQFVTVGGVGGYQADKNLPQSPFCCLNYYDSLSQHFFFEVCRISSKLFSLRELYLSYKPVLAPHTILKFEVIRQGKKAAKKFHFPLFLGEK